MEAIAPPDNAANAIQQAVNNGDVKTLKAIAPTVANTSAEPAVASTINKMDRAASDVNRVVANTNANGGVNTPEGRLALKDQILNEYRQIQPQKSFWNGLALGLLGKPEDSAKAATAGVPESYLAPGSDGKFYRVDKHSYSDVPDAVTDENGNLVPWSQAQKLGITGYKDIRDTAGYKSNITRNEEYTKSNIQEQATANAYATGYSVINNMNESIMDGLLQLKKANAGLPAQVLAQINGIASRSGSTAQNYSDALTKMSQASSTDAKDAALKVANQIGAELGIKPIELKGSNDVATSDGKNYSISDYISKTKNMTTSTQSENAWRAGKQEVVQGEWYKQLAKSNPELIPVFENIYNMSQSKDILKKQLNEKYGNLPLIAPTLPTDPSKSLESNIAQAHLDYANKENAIKYKKYIDDLLGNGVPIVPGSAAQQYTHTPDFAKVNNETYDSLKKVLGSMQTEPAKVEQPSTGTQTKALTAKSKKGVSPPDNALNASQEATLNRIENAAPPVPKARDVISKSKSFADQLKAFPGGQ